MSWSLTYQRFGEQAIVVNWPQKIASDIRKAIAVFEQKISRELSDCVEETVAAYCSLTIFVRQGHAVNDVIEHLKILDQQPLECDLVPSRLWHIPVCYEACFAPDLLALAQSKGLQVEAVIELHTRPNYRIDFIGFLPGFPYLSGLNSILHTPRLSEPRAAVKKGSVAIGGQQTGIYPSDSPGGWHIIGRTPVSLFNSDQQQPCFVKPLDKMAFYAIDLNGYHQITQHPDYQCQFEVLS